jgi:GR25 family glycosyltransferase involved in LPS biosynthesis
MGWVDVRSFMEQKYKNVHRHSFSRLFPLIIGIIVLVVVLTVNETKSDNSLRRIDNNRIEYIIKSSPVEDGIQIFLNDLKVETIYNNFSNDSFFNLKNSIYINLDRSKNRKPLIEKEIKTHFNGNIFRLKAYERKPGALGCYLSHLACLAFMSSISKPNEHIIIFEDDFQFERNKNEFENDLKVLNQVIGDEWDVIVLGQYVQEWEKMGEQENVVVMRLFSSTTTSGYIVNNRYIKTLFNKWYKRLQHILKFEQYFNEQTDALDQIQRDFQKEDLWFGFKSPIGGQRPGYSIIGDVVANNTWKCTDDLKYFIDPKGNHHKIILRI